MTLTTLVQQFLTVINQLLLVLSAGALAFFMYGVFKFIISSGNTASKKVGYDAILWGAVVLVVLVCLTGIVTLLTRSLLG